MSYPATQRQKQFLRALGHKDVKSISKAEASDLIDELLEKERASGKTFPCPYCNAPFGPRPRRRVDCPSCKRTIVHLSGKFYTEDEAAQRYEKSERRDRDKERFLRVRRDWNTELTSRRQRNQVSMVGYRIIIGPSCKLHQELDSYYVLLEDAFDSPSLLPPYHSCPTDSCDCRFVAVAAQQLPQGVRWAQWPDPEKQAKLTTRLTSPYSSVTMNRGASHKGSKGCSLPSAAIVLAGIPCLLAYWLLR